MKFTNKGNQNEKPLHRKSTPYYIFGGQFFWRSESTCSKSSGNDRCLETVASVPGRGLTQVVLEGLATNGGSSEKFVGVLKRV
jgi:hypothetical protein